MSTKNLQSGRVTAILVSFAVCMIPFESCRKYTNDTDQSPYEKKWMVTTAAGNGQPVFLNGPVLMSSFRAPQDVAVGTDGAIYVADALNHRIRKIADGQVSTFVGSGNGDTASGNGSVAGFALTNQLAFDNSGNLFALDLVDPRVRKVSPDGFVSVYAGTGVAGFADGKGDIAQFGKEQLGIALDNLGNIYISDYENKRIRKISTTGQVSTFAGNGQQGFLNGKAEDAQFFSPAGIVIDKNGNLFVGDWNRIRKITPSGIVSTFAGNEVNGYRDGEGNAALFTNIFDMVIDAQDNIFVSDENRIRKITPQGFVSTIAGSIEGYQDGEGTSAKFAGPIGLSIGKLGVIYVADAKNNRIRRISFE